ncbi:vegetative cell wall protein gp1-like isoform X2 [Cygnus olor]|uniref:vegetative cell wall protein gp1-like isoform X2 n=1 Tax=Cygnus olor TaxID=8869 RepID=UPI001ADE289F|nr:vegetative cell wall protein gp1-like isoform X2 [Cygnus olor]
MSWAGAAIPPSPACSPPSPAASLLPSSLLHAVGIEPGTINTSPAPHTSGMTASRSWASSPTAATTGTHNASSANSSASASVGTTWPGMLHPDTSSPLSKGNTTVHTPPPSSATAPTLRGTPKAPSSIPLAMTLGSPTSPAPATSVPPTTTTGADTNTSLPSSTAAPSPSLSGHPEPTPAPSSPAAPTVSPAPSSAPAPGPSNASAPSPSTAPIIGPSLGAGPSAQPPTKPNPGLVVIICLFVAVLVGAAALLLVRLCRCGTPRFQRLDESKVSEGFPFAQHPPR